MKNLFSKKYDFWFSPSGNLNIKRDYGGKSKGFKVFSAADVLFCAAGRKTLPRCRAGAPLRENSETRKCGQDPGKFAAA